MKLGMSTRRIPDMSRSRYMESESRIEKPIVQIYREVMDNHDPVFSLLWSYLVMNRILHEDGCMYDSFGPTLDYGREFCTLQARLLSFVMAYDNMTCDYTPAQQVLSETCGDQLKGESRARFWLSVEGVTWFDFGTTGYRKGEKWSQQEDILTHILPCLHIWKATEKSLNDRLLSRNKVVSEDWKHSGYDVFSELSVIFSGLYRDYIETLRAYFRAREDLYCDFRMQNFEYILDVFEHSPGSYYIRNNYGSCPRSDLIDRDMIHQGNPAMVPRYADCMLCGKKRTVHDYGWTSVINSASHKVPYHILGCELCSRCAGALKYIINDTKELARRK